MCNKASHAHMGRHISGNSSISACSNTSKSSNGGCVGRNIFVVVVLALAGRA